MSQTTTIPSKMHAAVLREYKKPFNYEEVPVPEVGDDDVLVQVKAAGYCHTDLQVNEGVYESAGAKPGMIGSHEPAGVVVKLVSRNLRGTMSEVISHIPSLAPLFYYAGQERREARSVEGWRPRRIDQHLVSIFSDSFG